MSLEPSTRLGPYEVKSLLGSGGMGEVYRGWDTRLRRSVAIKVLPAAYSANPDRLRRFEQEARAAAALNHPNILAVFDVGTEAGTPYVVSELLEGQTLREALGSGALSLRKALDYATQIATGLAAAHEKGIIHRDIKPANLFITTDGRIKLLDFGLAKLREDNDSDASATLTDATGRGSTGDMLIGTAGYMSPEQVRGERVDHRTDIFSFGATFYEMVGGARAFKGDTVIETLHAILNHDPQDLMVPDAPAAPGLARVIQHCLEKGAGQRFQSAQDLAFALGQLTGTSTSTAASSPAPAPSRRRRLLAAAAAIVVGLALSGSAYLLGTRATETTQPVFRQLTFQRGHICCPRFTPDGHSVFINAAWAGEPWTVFSTRLDTGASNALGLAGAELLSISRSGEMALLVKGGTLARVPIGQSGLREIVDGVRSADYAPDGTLAVIRVDGSRNWLEFPRGQVIFEDSATMWLARVSPDGELVAIAQQGARFEWLTIIDRRGNVRSRSTRRAPVGQEGLAWTPDGREVWFSAADVMFASAIHAMTPDGRERLVHRSIGSIRIDDIAQDGRALVIQDINRYGMSVVDTETRAERELTWLSSSLPRELSGDGRLLIFSAAGSNGRSGAHIRPTDGGPAVLLGDGIPMAISPDTKWVLASAGPPEAPLRLLPTGAGEMRTLDRGSIERFSTVGSWTPRRPTHRFPGERGRQTQQAVRPAGERRGSDTGDAGRRSRQTEGVRGKPIVSPDSSTIIGADAQGRLWKYRLDAAPTVALDGAVPKDVPLAWSPDGRSVWVLERPQKNPQGGSPTPARIIRIDLASARRTLWYDVPLPDVASMFADSLRVVMSADGRTFAYGYHQHFSDLYLAEGLK
jgi:hypothetical protein